MQRTLVAFTLSPSTYTTTAPNEVVALDLAIVGLPYVGIQQSLNMNIDGIDYFMGTYSNLDGADPWDIPFSFPSVPWGGIPPPPPTTFPKGAHTIFFQSCNQSGVNDGLLKSNTAIITLAYDYPPTPPPPPSSPFPWWLLVLALLGAGALGYYVYKKLL